MISYPLICDNDMDFCVESYNLKNEIAAHFEVPARFETEHYVIKCGREYDKFYFDVYFPDKEKALMFKLAFIR
jgi:hypothetical protein